MKILLVIAVSAALLLGLTGCRSADAANGQQFSQGTSQTHQNPQPNIDETISSTVPAVSAPSSADTAVISGEEAARLALEHAGVAADQATHLRTEPELFDRIPHYDVEFRHGGYEYDYEIHAQTGQVLAHEKEWG